jgi:hypothetical protein
VVLPAGQTVMTVSTYDPEKSRLFAYTDEG